MIRRRIQSLQCLRGTAVLFFAMSFSATSFAQSAGGGGGSDRPLVATVVSTKRPVLRCQEGSRSQFLESAGGGDRQVWVWRVCKDGRYYPRTAPVKVVRCSEGRVSRSTISDAHGRQKFITVICKNGRYVEFRSWEDDDNS